MSSASFPASGPADKALVRVDGQEGPGESAIYVLHLLGTQTPDNRLTVALLTAIMEALVHVEKAWDDSDAQKKGAALVTTAQVQPDSKFFSNGLDFEAAISDPDFFDKYLNPVYEKLLSFPIATVASVGGHAFAAGFGLAMAHDYRVFNGKKGYMCMNEVREKKENRSEDAAMCKLTESQPFSTPAN